MILLYFVSVRSEESIRIVELSGNWKFEIGDNMNWANRDFNDKNWESIKVPSDWESEGFPGYDGYAWYRKEFVIEEIKREESYYLKLGTIDDSDMAFVNGKLVGQTGGFPPDYFTAYSKHRKYTVPAEYLNNGKNIIAIRVFNGGMDGGLRYGDFELAKKNYGFQTIINLEGKWKFNVGDSKNWANSEFDDSEWNEIITPAFWEFQRYKNLDGFAWYRKNFILNKEYINQNLILLLGKIDDMDETYVNGHLIGATGDMKDNPDDISINDSDYIIIRSYYIPKHLLNYGGKNQIAVRVYDGFKDGGIYEGPLGIVNREQFRTFLENKKKNNQIRSKFQLLLNKIFKVDTK